MEKLIFRKFFKDTIYFFIIGTLSLSLIVWVIQAVNYLDFVSEDGHSFKVYFLYTLLNFPKIVSRLMIFMLFISIFYTISSYQDRNELIIFWTNGVKKKYFQNFIIKFSIVIMLAQLFLNLLLVPTTQDLARSYIRASNIDYFPSLLKSKKFISTVEDLTIFIEDRDQSGEFKNIFLKDNKNSSNPQIISASKGQLKKKNNYFLILYDGNIIDHNKKGSNIISYDKTIINLSKYSTKTTVDPKIQEQSTLLLMKCIDAIYFKKITFIEKNLNCNNQSIKNVLQELYKRLIVPFYIIIVSTIASCLLFKSDSDKIFFNSKILVFVSGIFFIILSQVLTQYSGIINNINLVILITPFLLIFIFYLILQFRMRE